MFMHVHLLYFNSKSKHEEEKIASAATALFSIRTEKEKSNIAISSGSFSKRALFINCKFLS